MDSELEALEQNKTWTIEKLPPHKKALGCKWVYKIKYKSDGTIERFKARLVILGNHQVAGVDYSETFASMDVDNAFLHGDLEEEVFMKLPLGLHKGQPGEACKLRKSLYGLRQAPRCWFSKLSSALKTYGFVQSYSDYSLFTLQQNGVQLNVLDLGNLKYFLGIEVARAKEGIFLCQRKYALDKISEVGLLGAKPAKISMEQNHHLGLAQRRLFEDPGQYRRLVGRLIYLCFTRPDLAYSVHVLSQFMQNPQIEHWEAAIRVVRYLKGSTGQGWLVYLGDSPISWKTKKQHIVSRSFAEAEYRSMSLTTGEFKWLKGILKSFGIHHLQPKLIYCDSQAKLHISRNLVFHERTKHIEVDYHYIRDELVSGNLDARHVHSKTDTGGWLKHENEGLGMTSLENCDHVTVGRFEKL
ncbi:retrovirus-related pol polyprotein from transposon RE2 [Tanacetum coccineum]